jgi:hypothetical protein
VADLRAEGKSTREIAAELNIGKGTVYRDLIEPAPCGAPAQPDDPDPDPDDEPDTDEPDDEEPPGDERRRGKGSSFPRRRSVSALVSGQSSRWRTVHSAALARRFTSAMQADGLR